MSVSLIISRSKLSLLLAVCVQLVTPALAEDVPVSGKSSRARLLCLKSGERTEGLNKICYFNCGNSERAIRVLAYDPCPRWKLRLGLKASSRQFGPRDPSR